MYLVYALLVIVVVNPAINIVLEKRASAFLNRTVTSGVAFIDPITLSATIHDFRVDEPTGNTLLEFDRFRVNAGLWRSLLRSEIALQRIDISGLSAQLILLPDGSLNITDLITTDPSTEAESGNAPVFFADAIAIDVDRLGLRDQSSAAVFNNALIDTQVKIDRLSTRTDADPGTLSLSTALETGGSLTATLELQVAQGLIEGGGDITSVALSPWWPYLMPDVASVLDSGAVGTSFSVDLEVVGEPKGEIALSELLFNNIAMQNDPVDRVADRFALASFGIPSIAVDLAQRHVELGLIDIDALRIETSADRDGATLATLFMPSGEKAGGADSAADTKLQEDTMANTAEPAQPLNEWSLAVAGWTLSEGDVQITSPLVKGGHLHLGDISSGKGSFGWPVSERSPFSLGMTINETATVDVTGDGLLSTGAFTAQIEIEALPLTLAEPLVAEDYDLALESGDISLSAEVDLKNYLPNTLNGRLEVEDLHMTIPGSGTELLRLRSLRIEDVALDAPAQSLVLGAVHLTGIEGSLVILEDGTLNANRIMRITDEVVVSAGRYAEQKAEEFESDDTGWRIQIPDADIYDSRIAFRDESLAVKFTAPIEELYVEMTGFDTATDSTVEVNGKGVIDGFAPVTLDGQLGHFSSPRNGFFEMTMRGVDLARLTPYSATYAGYPIERGVMSVTLDYTLENGGVNGSNNVIVEQLKLGDRDTGVEGTGLPIKAAVALLTNAAGVIDITLPVSGSVDDPSFGIASAAAQATATLITNVVAAPFKLLASLVGEEDVPDQIRFVAGRADLTPEATANLDVITGGLLQRPKLAVRLVPSIDGIIDREALARKAVAAELERRGITAEAIKTRSLEWETAMRTLASERGIDATLPLSDQLDAVYGSQPLDDTVFQNLASDRAAAIKAYMVNIDGFDPQRAVIDAWQSDNTDFLGVSLSVVAR
ncbi:conserved domain protein [Luminiphilus syltensis NOR5-1B]|uniref:Conserved domain protein n=2 Tax=Luminiphilus TaxID=1341118 RepID=B8KQZ2_9GAMM|nr:conserved domain protein [Luminiphilus syltensis NOR5-1B]